MQNNNTHQVLVTPLKPALIKNAAQKLPVLIRVQAPDPEPGAKGSRKPYHLSLVLDRSGSMSGQPLAEAVRCAKYMIDRLAPTDLASLVVFDDRVKTLVDAKPVGDRKALHFALSGIHSGGSTNLHGGWETGKDSLLAHAADAAIARTILLSDGNANVGELRETEPIAELCAIAMEAGVTTSTYGLGRDFNEDLMVAMARRGGENHYYGDTAADLFEPFAEEFDLIANLFARRVKLTLSAPDGVKITLLNDYPAVEQDGFPVINLPDIPFGAEAWALVELEVPAHLCQESSVQLLQAAVSAATPDGHPIPFFDGLLYQSVMSPEAWDALVPDALVAARQLELAAANLLIQARSAVESGDWHRIDRLISEAKARFGEHPWIKEMLQEMENLAAMRDMQRFSKESLYSSRKLHSRVSAKSEVLASLVEESAAPSFLRRKKSQGKAEFPPPPDNQ